MPRIFLPLLLVLVLSGCAGGETPAPPPPNVVVVLVDDLRWDDVAIAGHPFVETPNIDRLAIEGARFLNAFAATPLCSPSRATILTGQYAHTHGIIDNTARDAASHRLPTFAIPLAAAGYRTAFIGKWHMGNDDTRRPGWTRWVAMKGQGEAIDPMLNVDGERRRTTGHVTDVLNDYALEFVRESDDEPFMLFLAHKALHPNFIQRDDGSTGTVAGQPEGFVAAERHRRPLRIRDRAPPAECRHRACAKARVAARDSGIAATGSGDRDQRYRRAFAARDAAGRGRKPRANPAAARGTRAARKHRRDPHGRQRLLLWRARPQRGAATRLRGIGAHTADHPLPEGRARGHDAGTAGADDRPRAHDPGARGRDRSGRSARASRWCRCSRDAHRRGARRC